MRFCPLTTRLGKSPYFPQTVTPYTRFNVYNRMIFPVSYGRDDEDYWHLKRKVMLWDVSVQRQISITGKDAYALVDMISTRDPKNLKVGRCMYTFMCCPRGIVINDPVILHPTHGTFWLSISDNDVYLWLAALAMCNNMEVTLKHENINPLAIQGPLSVHVVGRLTGKDFSSMKKFGLQRATTRGGQSVWVARSGWSPGDGFEIYPLDASRGNLLWEEVLGAGKEWDIKVGAPHQAARIEGGMLSWGSDITTTTTPLDLGLPNFVKLGGEREFVGKKALQKINSPPSKIVKLEIGGDRDFLQKNWRGDYSWELLDYAKNPIGRVTSIAYSPSRKCIVALAMVEKPFSFYTNHIHVKVDSSGEVKDSYLF